MNRDWRTSEVYKVGFKLLILCLLTAFLLGTVWGFSIHRFMTDGEASLPWNLISFIFALLLTFLPIRMVRIWLRGLLTEISSDKNVSFTKAGINPNPKASQLSINPRNSTMGYPRTEFIEKPIKNPKKCLSPNIIPPSEANKNNAYCKEEKGIEMENGSFSGDEDAK